MSLGKQDTVKMTRNEIESVRDNHMGEDAKNLTRAVASFKDITKIPMWKRVLKNSVTRRTESYSIEQKKTGSTYLETNYNFVKQTCF